MLVLIAACGDNGSGLVRVTAYGRSQCGTNGVLAKGVVISSYDAAVDADLGKNTFATASTDASGVATLAVQSGGYIVYQACPAWLESIQGVEPGDDLIVGDPNPTPAVVVGGSDQRCVTPGGTMTVVFPTVANATSYRVNNTYSSSPSVVVSGCDGTQVPLLAQAYDGTGQSIGYQLQTVPFVDQSTLHVDALLPPAELDLTLVLNGSPPPAYPPALTETVPDLEFLQSGSPQADGTYRFVYPALAQTATLDSGGTLEVTIGTDQTSLAVDPLQLGQPPYLATRFVGEIGTIYDDSQPDVDYLIDVPPGMQPLLSFLPYGVPDPSDQHRYNAVRGYAVKDSQYDDYGDFRSQRRHLERNVQRSVVLTTASGNPDHCVGFAYTCLPTSR